MQEQQLSALLAQLGYDPGTIETMLSWAVYLTIASVIAAVPTGMIARQKGRSVSGWVIFSLCIPVVPLLIMWYLPDTRKQKEKT